MERINFQDTTPTGHWCSTGLSTLTSFVLHLSQIKVKLPPVNVSFLDDK